MRLLLAILGICAAVSTAFAAEGGDAPQVFPKKITLDTNKDGQPDRWEHYADGKLAKIELDANHDGKVDETITAVDGKLSRSEKDTDYDGKPDQWVDY